MIDLMMSRKARHDRCDARGLLLVNVGDPAKAEPSFDSQQGLCLRHDHVLGATRRDGSPAPKLPRGEVKLLERHCGIRVRSIRAARFEAFEAGCAGRFKP